MALSIARDCNARLGRFIATQWRQYDEAGYRATRVFRQQGTPLLTAFVCFPKIEILVAFSWLDEGRDIFFEIG